MAEAGVVTSTLLGMTGAGVDARVLARETLWVSDATAELLEDLQFTLNEGACLQAATSGSPVLVSDLHNSVEVAHWPMFAAAVMEHSEARALFAFPLQWDGMNLGVLDLYRVTPGGLSGAQRRDAESAISVAALMMLELRTDPDYDDKGRLNGPGANRAEVHQATGAVLAQLGINAEAALARLRGHAFAEQRLLIDVAKDVVAGRLRFTKDAE